MKLLDYYIISVIKDIKTIYSINIDYISIESYTEKILNIILLILKLSKEELNETEFIELTNKLYENYSFVNEIKNSEIINKKNELFKIIDGLCDIIVFSMGSIAKLTKKENYFNNITLDKIYNRVYLWNKERLLLEQEFCLKNEISFLLEELLEMNIYKNSDIDEREIVLNFINSLSIFNFNKNYINNNKEKILSNFENIINTTILLLESLNIDYYKAMNETLKEIESRKGKIIDGKFVKDKNIKYYKADYNKVLKDKHRI